jgi:PAS domain S-box-containing protein
MFEAMMDSTTDSIVYSNLEGIYVEVSKKKADNWGLTRRQMIGKSDYDFMSKEEADQARCDSMSVIESGVPIIDCIRKAVRSNESVWYSLSEYPWVDEWGNIIGTISTSRDVTDRINNEQKSIAMSEQILEMLKIVSHDLCSPLTNISAIAKRGMKGRFGNEKNPISEVIHDFVRDAFEDIFKRILKQRGAVLDYLYKFNNLKECNFDVETEIVDLRTDVIDEVLEELDDLIQDNESTIDSTLGLIPEGSVILQSCKVQLKIVYRNLISNSLKYGGKGCVISFGFEDWNDRFALNVFNNGPAVPPEEIDNLFEPFVQGKNVSKGSGLGIGLYTIRNMIRNLGGDMWYETTPSNYPNFIFTAVK